MVGTLRPDNAASLIKPAATPSTTAAGASPSAQPAVTSRARRYGGLEPKPVSSPDKGLALGIFAPGGVGKTTLAATITDSDLGTPALYLDARGNPHVISSYGDRIDTVEISTFGQVEAVRQDILKDRDCPYKSVILDNVSEMWALDLRDRYGAATVVDWTQHSVTTAELQQLMRNWFDLTTSKLKLNVVFIFQESPENRVIRGTEVKSRSEVAFNGALQRIIPSLINFLGRLYISTDAAPYTRVLDFRPIETMHQAKIQIDPHDPYASQIPMEIYNPSLASILDTIRGHKPWPTEKHQKPSRPQRSAPATS